MNPYFVLIIFGLSWAAFGSREVILPMRAATVHFGAANNNAFCQSANLYEKGDSTLMNYVELDLRLNCTNISSVAQTVTWTVLSGASVDGLHDNSSGTNRYVHSDYPIPGCSLASHLVTTKSIAPLTHSRFLLEAKCARAGCALFDDAGTRRCGYSGNFSSEPDNSHCFRVALKFISKIEIAEDAGAIRCDFTLNPVRHGGSSIVMHGVQNISEPIEGGRAF